MNNKKFTIGLFGFGTVGHGLFDLLQLLKNPTLEIKTICVRDITKRRNVQARFTDNPDNIFNDPEINMVVELIDNAEASYQIVKRAIEQHIPVVSGNKRMLAYNLPELISLQQQHGTPLLYDASACGSIPVIRNLEEYYDNDLLISVKGILNGSSNFILSKIFNEGMPYQKALEHSKKAGFVESDPSLDLDGWDSLFKLIIITVHAFGLYVPPEKIFTFGITSLNDNDIRFANEKGRRIKLVAHVEKLHDGRLTMCVIPQLLSRNKYIYGVDDEFNGVVIKGLYYDKQFMFGRGAGGRPTGSAILSDITACQYNYKYEYKKLYNSELPHYDDNVKFRLYCRYQSDDQLDMVEFEEITESYRSADFNYVVGIASLNHLHANAEKLRKSGIFLAAYPYD